MPGELEPKALRKVQIARSWLQFLGFAVLDEFADFARSPDKPEDSKRQHRDPSERQ
jgi:hypothetical protein